MSIETQFAVGASPPVAGGTLHVSQIDLFAAICKELERQAKRQRRSPLTARSEQITGASSMAMAHRMFCVYASDRVAHPHDPDDFGRCVKFIAAVPGSAARLSEMADVSPTWAKLVAAWPELVALYERDVPTGRSQGLLDRLAALTA